MSQLIVSSGQTVTVSSGQTLSGVEVLSGGTQIVLAGGIAINDMIAAGGTVSDTGALLFTPGAGASIAIDGTVVGGGALTVSGPGTLVLSGDLTGYSGTIHVDSGTLELTSATAAGTAVIDFGSAGTDIVKVDGSVAPTNVITGTIPADGDSIWLTGLAFAGTTLPSVNGNTVTVTEGAASETLTINGARSVSLHLTADKNGGTDLLVGVPNQTISAGQTVIVSAGQTNTFANVLAGGLLSAAAGGTVSGADITGSETIQGTDDFSLILSGGTQTILAGGIATGGVVNAGGIQIVSSGAQAFGEAVLAGGEQLILSSGFASGTIVAGGLQVISSGGIALDDMAGAGATVSDGGTLLFSPASGTSAGFGGTLVGGGTVLLSGPGTEVLSGDLTGFSGTILLDSGTLELTSATAGGTGIIRFGAIGSATLRVDGTAAPTNVITGTFPATGDAIWFPSLAYSGNASATVHGNTVTITEGAFSETLTINGGNRVSLNLAADKAGGTDLYVGVPGEVISFGQVVAVSSGQTIAYPDVTSGGALSAGTGGTVSAGYIAGVETVQGVDSLTTVLSGGVQNVVQGGTVISGLLSAGGIQTVSAGGVVTYETVLPGGIQYVSSGGTVTGSDIAPGGEQVVFSGGVAINDVASAGSIVSDNGSLVFIESAGVTSTVAATLTGSGTIVQSGIGTLALAGDLTGFSGGITISGGTLELTSGVAAGTGAITFDPAVQATLKIDGLTAPSNVISGFHLGAGDLIWFASVAYAGTDAATISGNTVTVTEGSVTETLTIDGVSALAGAGLSLKLSQDASGGTDMTVACYCPGTLIATPDGDVAIETLREGDLVMTAAGPMPVRWIGRRSYGGRFLRGKRHLLPVRIQAGALGGGLPRRDLLVSPNHAMYLGGLLIPAWALADGAAIQQDLACQEVHYVHLELPVHTVIFAEGAASETYLDDDNRMMFHNGVAFDGEPAVGSYCAPRVVDGFALEAVRRRLAGQRAAA